MSQHRSHQPRNRRRRIGFALVITLALAASALTGSAIAANGSGQVVLTLTDGNAGSLLDKGVKVTYSARAGKTGATKSAVRRPGNGDSVVLELPVTEVALHRDGSILMVDGALRLRAGKRSARLRAIELNAGEKGAALSAKLGKKRLVVFRASGDTKRDSGALKLTGATLSLTAKGAARLGQQLGLPELAAGETGRLGFSARFRHFGSLRNDVVTLPVPAPPADDKPTPDPGPPYPYAAECPVGAVSGAPSGFGDPPGKVTGIAPAPTFDVGQGATGTAIEWGFKDSFRNYVLALGKAGSIDALDGAGANPAGATMATAGSFFDFPLAEGTYEAGSAGDFSEDKLVADGSGTVLFCKSGHGFSVVLKDPTVTIDGADSRITADVGVNSQGTWYPFQRADIAELDLSAVEPALSDGGNTLVWEDIPASVSADGSAAMGLYAPGTALDKVTVRTSLQRPLLSECAIDAGAGSLPRPAVDFTLAGLPELTDPVEMSGGDLGTINWGFRRGTRNAAVSSGGFQLLGGATESYPGNMGGGPLPTLPPTGGSGKFFRFPIASYAYDENTAAAGDDQLITTSNATVGICNSNPMTGNFAVVISKPTLVIDGGDSRIVANAYSFRGPDFGWAGGRVDLVDLDTSSVSAVAGAGVVSWGEVLPDETPLENGIPVDGGFQTKALELASGLGEGSGGGGFDPVAARIKLPPEPYPYEAQCPVPTGASSDAPGIVGGIAPAPVFDVDQEVTGTTIEWGFKDSLREYVLNSPPSGSLPVLDGAGDNPAGPTMATAGSFFDFPVAEGTYEAGSAADHSEDKLVADGGGTVLFCKAGHGFNVVLRDPTVTIDGEDSRITADVGVNSEGTWYPFQRVDIAELDLSAVEPALSDGGNTLVWEDIPATLTAAGREATSLSGFYAVGEALDKVTVRTSLQRPLLNECAIDAGADSLPRPTIDFTPEALPVLTDPVEASGGDLGTINWGFRRATRNSAVSSGGYQLLGGATEGYPGNMGGAAGSAPAGGNGKFFRFPISSYAYDENTAAAGDDQLITTSNATVGICNSNPMTGNFAVVISKPTLVIDGGDSRIVANAYSFRGPDFGWAGGRVDLVDLDSSGVAAVTGSGTVSWGEVTADNTPLNVGIPVDGGLPTNALTLATLPEGGGSGGFDPVAAQIELPAP